MSTYYVRPGRNSSKAFDPIKELERNVNAAGLEAINGLQALHCVHLNSGILFTILDDCHGNIPLDHIGRTEFYTIANGLRAACMDIVKFTEPHAAETEESNVSKTTTTRLTS